MPVFQPNEANTPSSIAYQVFLWGVIISMPWWIPACIPDQEKDAAYMCAKENRELKSFSGKGFLPSYSCGRKIKPEPVLIHQP